jgi:hypothetical protein
MRKYVFLMMMKEIVLGNHIFANGIEFDPSKIIVINNLRIPQKKKDVCIFLGHVGFYRTIIHTFRKLATPLHSLLTKGVIFS